MEHDEQSDSAWVARLAARIRPGRRSSASERDIERLVAWATKVVADGMMLQALMEERLFVVGWKGDQPVFIGSQHIEVEDVVLAAEEIVQQQQGGS